MRVPIQVIKDSMKTRRSKFLRQADPALRSLAGEPEEVEICGDGSNSTPNNDAGHGDNGAGGNKNANNTNGGTSGGEHVGKLSGQLTGHLNGLYNGLTKIMSSTCKISHDDLKAPFAIEKAIHNIMFIKHHMKRQDEFDAVSQSTFKLINLAFCM